MFVSILLSFTPSSLHQILKEEEKKKVVTKRKAYFYHPLFTTESPAIAYASCPPLAFPIFSFSPLLLWLLPGRQCRVPSERAAPSTTGLRATSIRAPTRRCAAWLAPNASAKRGGPRKPPPCWAPRGTKPSDPVASVDSMGSMGSMEPLDLMYLMYPMHPRYPMYPMHPMHPMDSVKRPGEREWGASREKRSQRGRWRVADVRMGRRVERRERKRLAQGRRKTETH